MNAAFQTAFLPIEPFAAADAFDFGGASDGSSAAAAEPPMPLPAAAAPGPLWLPEPEAHPSETAELNGRSFTWAEAGDLIDVDAIGFARPDRAGGGGGKKKDKTAPPPEEPVDTVPDSGVATYTSGPDGGYNIEVVFLGSWTDALQSAFFDAAEMISSVITGDLADVLDASGQLIDDLRIEASLTQIDGVNGILGQAGPTSVRVSSYLPVEGIMEFDAADAEALLASGDWQDVIFHEMMHCVGFGTLWQALGLVEDFGGDLRFVGAEATAVYNRDYADIAAGDPLSEYGVPVETDGGAGTAGGHWDEAIFGAEVMTGFAGGNMYLSDMTVASLEDLGYETVHDSALLIV